MSDDLSLRYNESMRRMTVEMLAEGRGYRSATAHLGPPPATARK